MIKKGTLRLFIAFVKDPKSPLIDTNKIQLTLFETVVHD